MIFHNRQAGTKLSQIREDHVNRYRAAAKIGLKAEATSAADLGCGFGYGSWILSEHFARVDSYDIDGEVFDFANRHWNAPNISRHVLDASKDNPKPADLLVMFEVLEHFECEHFLRRALGMFPTFVGSVPNEEVVPYKGKNVHPEHVRHYTPDELVATLTKAGWKVVRLGCQTGKRGREGEVKWDQTKGRTLVFHAVCP